jgi:hypothetical protein
MNVVLSVLDAFVNTLWQAAATAFLVWMLLRFMRRINAATRYAVWCATLIGVVLLPFEVREVSRYSATTTFHANGVVEQSSLIAAITT